MSDPLAVKEAEWISLEKAQALSLVEKLLRTVQEVDLYVDDDLNVQIRPADAPRPAGDQRASASSKRFILDVDTREVWIEGRCIEDITLQEFDLLSYLYDRRGTFVSPEEVCEELWPGEDFDDRLGALYKLVSRTRAKIEPDPKNPVHLQVMRGRGYRLAVK